MTKNICLENIDIIQYLMSFVDLKTQQNILLTCSYNNNNLKYCINDLNLKIKEIYNESREYIGILPKYQNILNKCLNLKKLRILVDYCALDFSNNEKYEKYLNLDMFKNSLLEIQVKPKTIQFNGHFVQLPCNSLSQESIANLKNIISLDLFYTKNITNLDHIAHSLKYLNIAYSSIESEGLKKLENLYYFDIGERENILLKMEKLKSVDILKTIISIDENIVKKLDLITSAGSKFFDIYDSIYVKRKNFNDIKSIEEMEKIICENSKAYCYLVDITKKQIIKKTFPKNKKKRKTYTFKETFSDLCTAVCCVPLMFGVQIFICCLLR